jgi:hypothetical protein
MEGNFDLADTVRALAETPGVLRALLARLPEAWLHTNEGPETWSPFDVVGHLIHGEKTDWIPRAKHILQGPPTVPFEPFDRLAQFHESGGKTLATLLDEFAALRQRNLDELAGLALDEADLDLEGTHPELGTVKLRQLLATWVCHDYSHIGQIARVLAKRHREAVGPWARYLSILHR